jgi:inosine/xanthosine triphosphatase
MPQLAVASTNPVKIQSALNGFRRMFPQHTFAAEGVAVPSGVSHQPMTDAETLQGAINRVASARQYFSQADYWVGIEGGCEMMRDELTAFAWVVVQSPMQLGKARTGVFFLPKAVAQLVQRGVELGEADDRVFGRINSKQGNGAIGLLTDDVIDRVQYYEHAVILALVPFKNSQLYQVTG